MTLWTTVKIGVCGIGCHYCPKMLRLECPNGDLGCVPRENTKCAIASCAYEKQVMHCFQCPEFPCEKTGEGPIKEGYCQYLCGKKPL